MLLAANIENFIEQLPDAAGARRFYAEFAERFPADAKKLFKNTSLLSDVLTLAAYSPLLATTILQNPSYVAWLERQRVSIEVRGKDALLEALERFALINSGVETNVLLARFRRRELLRIYLRDIRRLGTVVEITEEISHLADAILEYALRRATQELDNRYGAPLVADEKKRAKPARLCIVALGKLGSFELNYSSDIDLLFLYSADGATGGAARAAITNREYFVKLAEAVTKIVGGQAGEGAAYRVDLRLRPNGRVGALAISAAEAAHYYEKTARVWERQVLIRARAAAGAPEVFREFYGRVARRVFSKSETVENALESVRQSKEQINREKTGDARYNVKLGAGGIREIEFIAQALQLAYGGADEWLRRAHTLISLVRLADRRLIYENELTELFAAYEFLRRLEHRLQMENGLQTHLVPIDAAQRALVSRRMGAATVEDFERDLKNHTANVHRVFRRVFGAAGSENAPRAATAKIEDARADYIENATPKNVFAPLVRSLEKSDRRFDLNEKTAATLAFLSENAPHFAAQIAANPSLAADLPNVEADLVEKNYKEILLAAVAAETVLPGRLAVLRKNWSRSITEIAVFDAFGRISRQTSKRRQTALAEAAVEAALFIAKAELEKKYSLEINEFPIAVLGLGKLGGGGLDYGSDLDLILIYGESGEFKETDANPKSVAAARHAGKNESDLPVSHSPLSTLHSPLFYSRAVEIFVNALSGLTREGFLYRVDLRLRPDGKNGALAVGKTTFLNYLRERAAVWEWLAYVKLRAVGGDLKLAQETERAARRIVHANARNLKNNEPTTADADDSSFTIHRSPSSNDDSRFTIHDSRSTILRDEAKRVRERLETEKAGARAGKEIDIKFGAGGMLDVYFAVRFLQLRDRVPDTGGDRSTAYTLRKLRENNSLRTTDFQNLSDGYEFLTELDHQLRLVVGRSTRLPLANQTALEIIRRRMKLNSVADLLEQLTVHRLNIRRSYEEILKD